MLDVIKVNIAPAAAEAAISIAILTLLRFFMFLTRGGAPADPIRDCALSRSFPSVIP